MGTARSRGAQTFAHQVPGTDPSSRASRVLYVSHVAQAGGAERSLIDLLAALDRRRIEAHALLPAPGPLAERLRRMDVPVHYARALGRVYRTFHPARLTRQVERVLRGAWAVRRVARRLEPELIHANSLSAALFCLPATISSNRPLVWQARDFPRGIEAQWVRSLGTAAIVSSRACYDALSTRPGRGLERIHRVPNGIAIPHASTLRAHARPASVHAPVRILTVGHFAPWKGHRLLLDAAHRVLQRRKDVTFAIAGDDLIGDRPDEARRLRARAAELGIAAHVRFLGEVPNAATLLSREADILVHPAYPEPFGRVVIEALAAGCPVIALRGKHGPAEILAQGAGLLVRHDADALAQAISTLVDDVEQRQRLAIRGRALAEQMYGREAMAQRVTALYSSILWGSCCGRSQPGGVA